MRLNYLPKIIQLVNKRQAVSTQIFFSHVKKVKNLLLFKFLDVLEAERGIRTWQVCNSGHLNTSSQPLLGHRVLK